MNGAWLWIGAALVALTVVSLLRIGWRARGAEWGNALLNSLDGLTRLFCARFHRFRYDPVVLPDQGGAILACNHYSGLDPLLMISAVSKPLRFMIAEEQYHRFGLNLLYRAMGTIPVDREGAAEKAFYAARKALDEGEIIGVFPQGRITLPGESVPLKRGVILLADLAGAPIIPLRLSGIRGVGKVVFAVFMRSRARLEVGAPIRVEGPRDAAALRQVRAFLEDPPRPESLENKRHNPT